MKSQRRDAEKTSKKAKELESTRLLGKIFETHRIKKKIYNTYEMIKINIETYAKNCIDSMTVKNKKRTAKNESWASKTCQKYYNKSNKTQIQH